MYTKITNWLFNLSNPVYLIHPNYKFWQAKQNGKNITFRVGKISDEIEDKIQQISKLYLSVDVAKTTLITKIEEKLTKGYIPKNPIQDQTIEIDKKQQQKLKKDCISSQRKNKRRLVDQSQKKTDSIKSEVDNVQVRIKKIDKNNQKNKNIIEQQQIQIKSEKLKENERATKNIKKNQKSYHETKSNFLSVTKMTDDALSHRSSRNLSSVKSNRSYEDDDNDNDINSNVPSRLGNPTSQPISVLLAQTWENDVDPTDWIMSQKLDGVRCFWTGTTMFSRNAKRFYCPKFFTKGWPKSQMDGQLFIGRGRFSQTVSVVRKNVPIDQQWKKIKYLVFDCPGLKVPFTERLKKMEEVIHDIDNPYLKCHAHRVCQGFEDLFQQLNEVEKKQGEGLMLRDPNSMYENRRSKSLLKVKKFYDDQAEIIGYKPGTGRCEGMVGALRVRNTKGVQFEVGSGMNDKMRKKPPGIGTMITYKYQQFNKDSGKPRFPIFLRIYTKI